MIDLASLSVSHLSRRRFCQFVASAAAIGLIERPTAARLLRDTNRLSWRAHRTAGAEGVWELEKIDGKIPAELVGTLYRTAPGESERFGVTFKHLFDGDAFLSGYSIREGKVTLRAQFLDSPMRKREQKQRKMIFSEFGTLAPSAKRLRTKNQPSVNVIHWDGRLLGLSEGGHPTAIDPETLAYQGTWDFHGTLPRGQTFTAHPKFDPVDGRGYCYGIVQGPGMSLRVFAMEKNGKLTRLYELPQPGFFMVHDMVLTKEHIVFLIPPVTFDIVQMMSGKASPGDALRFAEKNPLRILILRKDGKGKPVTIKEPAALVFHHGNAFEKEGALFVDTFLTPDGSILKQLHDWANDKMPRGRSVEAMRLRIDLEKAAVTSRDPFGKEAEFPRFDERFGGTDARYLYSAGRIPKDDPFAFGALLRHDRKTGKQQALAVEKHQTVAEPVFVPRRGADKADAGWLLQLGFDGKRDETFLDIIDAQALERLARVWAGTHLPLGFHGNFEPELFVKKKA